MTNSLLVAGCAILAFSPTAFPFFLLCFSKAHLIIIVTTSAFAYLISSLLSSLLWLPFSLTGSWIGNAAFLIIPAVICQTACRCGFVSLYHRVEGAISASIRLHEQRQEEQDAADRRPTNNHLETKRLRLELNDWSCGIAAGIGYGGMHSLMLYGSLLASEAASMGTLYQPSCPQIPALVNSALNAFFFSILDILLMLLTFYALRRRRYHQNATAPTTEAAATHRETVRRQANATLLASFLLHLMAGLSTTANSLEGGCKISLPLLASTVLASAVYLYAGIGLNKFLPKNQRVMMTNQQAAHQE